MYEKALRIQSEHEAKNILNRLLYRQDAESNRPLEEKLKDHPESAEKKMLAAMVATIVTTHALEAAIAKIMAELHYLREVAAKDHHISRQQNLTSSPLDQDKGTKETVERPLSLTDLETRLDAVKEKIEDLKNLEAELEHQQEQVLAQVEQIHRQEISTAFQELGLENVSEEHLDAFNEINQARAEPIDTDRILNSSLEFHQQEVEKAEAAGLPPPAPLFIPPPEEFKQRVEQARDPAWEVKLHGETRDILKEDPELKQRMLEFIYKTYPNEVVYDRGQLFENKRVRLPLDQINDIAASTKALRHLMPMFKKQVEAIKQVNQHFGGEKQRIRAMILDALTEQDGLEHQVHDHPSYTGAPVSLATTPSMSPLFGQSGSSSSSVDQEQETKKENDTQDGPSIRLE